MSKPKYTVSCHHVPHSSAVRWLIKNPRGAVIATGSGERSARRIAKALNAYKERNDG